MVQPSPYSIFLSFILFLTILFIYSWEIERERERQRQAEGEAGSSQEPHVGLDPESQDHDLSLRQTLNRWVTQVSQDGICFTTVALAS